MFKIIHGTLPWTDKADWVFPEADKNRLGRCFTDGPGDLDTAIPMLLPHLKDRRTCIQAGGAIGVWPLRLAQFFNNVVTLEPEPTNFHCLEANTYQLPNVVRINAALGNDNEPVRMELSDGERKGGNCGAWYTMPGGDIPKLRIDELHLDNVDLIYLDIEGAEHDAILGAVDTITTCRPVIGVEDKGLNMGRRAVDLLVEDFGYKIIGRPFKLDVILA